MLLVLRGGVADQLPWAPRMDLWAIAHQARGTLPVAFREKGIAGIAQQLSVGCRAVGADFTRTWSTGDLMLRGLGIENHPDFPYRVELVDFPLTIENRADGTYRISIETPAGHVVTELLFVDDQFAQGSYDPYPTMRAIRSADDLEAVALVFEHLRVIPQRAGYSLFRRAIGEQGVAVGGGLSAASPMHLIIQALMEFEQFVYLYTDDPNAVHALAASIEPFYDRVLDVVLDSDAEVFLWGANYDQSVTWPAFFATEIGPWLRKASDRAHAHGKLLLTHADGENARLLPYYPSCGIDVAESVCTRPMVSNSLAELRAGFGQGTTIWGGIPAVALLDDAMDDAEFERVVERVFDDAGAGDRLILGVSDAVPPDASMVRMQQIAQRARSFRPMKSAEAHS
jgi:hypothetical protein